jgi:hypothetical protein
MFEKRYHIEFSGINHSTVYHNRKEKREKNTIMNLILTLFTAFTTPIYWEIADWEFPEWEITRARIVTDKETDIPTVSCLVAL